MAGAKTRNPVPRNRRPAIKSKRGQFITIAKEITGTVLAALIFSAIVWTSAFGAAGGFDHADAGLILAGMVDHE